MGICLNRLVRDKYQCIVFLIFCLLNLFLFTLSVGKVEDGVFYSATYWNASDGQRYWGAAIDLADHGEFTVQPLNHEPLSRAGPLPAMVFGLPIKLVGFQNAPSLIVIMQCMMLYLMGLLTGSMARQINVSEKLTHGFVVFNPNLVGLAHHAQSDLIFAFILTFILYICVRVINEPEKILIKHFVFLGIAAGCLPLARAAGQYYVLLLPFMLTISFWITSIRHHIDWWRVIQGLVASSVIVLAITFPWALRNHVVLNDFGLSQSEAIMMRDQYKFLLRLDGIEKSSRSVSLQRVVVDYLETNGLDISCVDRFKDAECKNVLSRAYLSAILDRPPHTILRGLLLSWTTLFFTGATSRISDYIGVEVSNIHKILTNDLNGVSSIKNYLSVAAKEYGVYMILFIPFTLFAVITRAMGLIGLWKLLKRPTVLPALVIFILSVGIFVGMYQFIGLSRYRAPLEPILMLLAAAAFLPGKKFRGDS